MKPTKEPREKRVEIGADERVVIDKLFGPLIFADLRITADFQSNSWIIERMIIKSGAWIEWCRIPGQLNQEFTDWEKP